MLSEKSYDAVKFMNLTDGNDLLFGFKKNSIMNNTEVYSYHDANKRKFLIDTVVSKSYDELIKQFLVWVDFSLCDAKRFSGSAVAETANIGISSENIFNPVRKRILLDMYRIDNEIAVSIQDVLNINDVNLIFAQKNKDGSFIIKDDISDDMREFIRSEYVKWTNEALHDFNRNNEISLKY